MYQNDRIGTTNKNYNQCIYRGISRLEAEELLLNAKLDGSFLVRESETVEGAYTLCVLFEKRVHQYRVLPDGSGQLSIEREEGVVNKKYVNLSSLIHDYVLRGSRNGLAAALKYPICLEAVEIASEDDLDSDDERDDDAEGRMGVITVVTPYQTVDHSVNERQTQLLGDLEVFVHNYFMQRLGHLDISGYETNFIGSLKRYVTGGSSKDVHLYESSQQAPAATHLHAFLEEEAKDLMFHVEVFMKKIDLWRQLFGPLTTSPLVCSSELQKSKSLFGLLDQMGSCKAAINNLEKKAGAKFRDLVRMWKEGGVILGDPSLSSLSSPLAPTSLRPDIPPCPPFEVKIAGMSGTTRASLIVDIMGGRLAVVKSKDQSGERSVYSHEKIEQLVKSTTCNTKLDMKIEGLKKKTITFEDTRLRESFCQLIQQLKNTNSCGPEVNYISLYIGTWNMGSEMPLYCLQSWLRSVGLGKKRNVTLGMIAHDVYVIGTQESSLSEKEWSGRILSILMESFGEEFYVVATASLWSIRTVVFAKAKYKNRISNVEQSSVKTGIANALGNKGAAGISFYFGGTSFCFINSHLTSGGEKAKRRNQNFRDIIKALDLGGKCSTDVTNKFHHVFFFGDLNYRVDGLHSSVIIDHLKTCKGDYRYLLGFDQLKKVQQDKTVFVGFKEEEILFPPTYRFQKGSRDHYVWQKIKTTGVRVNVPSWCDRILWKSYPSTWIANTSYGCCENICSSDHKPVFGSFDVKLYNQFSSSSETLNSGLLVVFHEVNVELKSSRQENFQLEFFSVSVEGPTQSKPNVIFSSKEGYICPKWSSDLLPELHPITDDLDHLEEQHILVCIKNSETFESYGECILALKTCFAAVPQLFMASLTHLGEETGSLKCSLQIKTKNKDDSRNFTQRKTSVDLVYMDTDFLLSQTTAPISVYEEVQNTCKATQSTTLQLPTSHANKNEATSYSTVSKITKLKKTGTCNSASVIPPALPSRNTRNVVQGLQVSKNKDGQSASISNKSSVQISDTVTEQQSSYVKTVEEWLRNIGLKQYFNVFMSNGWDSLSFLKHIDDEELLKIGITHFKHREIILKAITDLHQN